MNEFSDSVYLPPDTPHRPGVSPIVLGLLCLGCLLVGCVIGFGVGSSDFGSKVLAQRGTSEKQAQLSPANGHKGTAHHFEYPANWVLNEQPGYYIPDETISIDTPGSAQWVLSLEENPSDPEWIVERLEGQYTTLLGEVTSKPFESSSGDNPGDRIAKWGDHLGAGVELYGTYFGYQARVRIFAATLEQRSFSVVEFFYVPDTELTRPGFEQIENSFELTDKPQLPTATTESP